MNMQANWQPASAGRLQDVALEVLSAFGLKGVVDRTADKNLAEIIARSVPGVFSVTNDLRA
jgi:hypothetical protein